MATTWYMLKIRIRVRASEVRQGYIITKGFVLA